MNSNGISFNDRIHSHGSNPSDDRTSTMLELCIGMQRDNQNCIYQIQSRITGIITRLRGESPSSACEKLAKDTCGGILVHHKLSLGDEREMIGEIQADLEVLESLL